MKRVVVITASDKGYKGEREDLSGPAVKEIVEAAGYQVVSMDVLPDDRGLLSARMAEIADQGLAELILTTGGTGFSQRDVTPEATEDVIERRVPGIPEAMRAFSLTITKRAILSRATFASEETEPGYGWDPKEDADHQSAGEPEGCAGEPGGYY